MSPERKARQKPKHTLSIGESCRWFFEADPGNPRAAIVIGPVQPRNDGYVDLAVFTPNVLSVRTVQSVPHMSDPKLSERPEWKASKGAWDYVEATCPAPEETTHRSDDTAARAALRKKLADLPAAS